MTRRTDRQDDANISKLAISHKRFQCSCIPWPSLQANQKICEINFKSFLLIAFFKIKMPANFADCLMARKSGDDYPFLFHHSKLFLIGI